MRTPRAYYNENDPYVAQWLRNLIVAGHIAPGEVDDRSIVDVRSADLEGFDQCHFFAGVGGWSLALRFAGWPDDRPVWTASAPCQPFSAAGKREGFADDRHLWPEMYRLVRERRPVVVFGEQVASRDGLAWLDLVHADLEGAGYTVGAVDICAAASGFFMRRPRLYFVANPDCERQQRWTKQNLLTIEPQQPPSRRDHARRRRENVSSGAEVVVGRDGNRRRLEPGLLPLAHGVPARVGRLRAYGNAIVPRVAAEVIGAYMELRP